jgi:FAD:protein FMN transferase
MNEHSTVRGPSRREFLTLGAGIFTVSALGIGWNSRRLVRRSVPVMGTIAEVAVVARDERRAHAAISAAVEELYRTERLMTRFTDDSDVGRANRTAFDAPVQVSAATAAVLMEGLRWAALDGSCFDPCIGRASGVWDVVRRTEPPVPETVHRLAGRRLYRAVELDVGAVGGTIRFTEPDAALDLGGIAKGYAVDRAVAALREWGISDGLVNAGGDLYALGRSHDGEPWRVGVRSPSDPHRLAGTLSLQDRAVATSGDYEQFFEHGGRRYHHLIDPQTAAPRVTSTHSLTVAADSCMAADAAATAVFGLEPADAARIVARAGSGAGIVLLV